ncbi:MAG: L-threonylcarbamoyladenylate synthase [Actinomycetota bacterium]
MDPTPELASAGAALRTGKLVVLPTDTVYGVAALPRARGSIAAIFEAKGRPTDKALPVLAASIDDLTEVVSFDARAVELGGRYWPGPLTIVLPRKVTWPYDLGGDDSTSVAVRIPRSEMARGLLELTGPLAVTSANLSGESPATTIEEARAHLGDRVAVYLDGGRCSGQVSTVLSLVGEPRVLRPGAIPAGELLG